MVFVNKLLFDVLMEVGFDVILLCLVGVCGVCKVMVWKGKVDYKSIFFFMY